MFHMMNEARVAVGAGAVALGYTAYLKSLDYARTRTQGRPPGAWAGTSTGAGAAVGVTALASIGMPQTSQ